MHLDFWCPTGEDYALTEEVFSHTQEYWFIPTLLGSERDKDEEWECFSVYLEVFLWLHTLIDIINWSNKDE